MSQSLYSNYQLSILDSNTFQLIRTMIALLTKKIRERIFQISWFQEGLTKIGSNRTVQPFVSVLYNVDQTLTTVVKHSV